MAGSWCGGLTRAAELGFPDGRFSGSIKEWRNPC
ncbi:MAG: hypothetical protein ACI8R4_004379, partial [Paracoccaceae bacterium]